MATALDTKPETASSSSLGLLPASIVGAVVMLAGLAIVGYAVPMIWESAVSPVLKPLGGFIDSFLRLCVLLAALAGVIFVANKFVPANPPRGLRGGIALVALIFVAFFFIVLKVGLFFENNTIGSILTGIVAAALAFGAYKFLTSERATTWMVALEEMGWFHMFTFKKTQGLRVRRWTMIGILLLGGTGVYSLMSHNTLPVGDWTTNIPFTSYEKDGKTVHKVLPLLADIRFTGPILLIAATIWLAWRAINVPTFADFLIATEAEMNKVSWTSWKKLVQDTIVVLVTTALLTAFLLLIDIFWGWLLSDVVRVLPHKSGQIQKADPQGQSATW